MKKIILITSVLLLSFSASAGSDSGVIVRKYKPVEEIGKQVRVREIKSADMAPSEGSYPCAFSIIPLLEWPSAGCDVNIFRFNLLVGQHRTVTGVDFGVLGNRVVGETAGLSVAGIWNDCGVSIGSIGAAAVANYSVYGWDGLQLSCVNCTEGEMNGVQLGVLNMAGRDLGLQVGVCNLSGKSIGVQVGIVNVSEALSGLQLGLVNVNIDSSLPVLPFVNMGF